MQPRKTGALAQGPPEALGQRTAVHCSPRVTAPKENSPRFTRPENVPTISPESLLVPLRWRGRLCWNGLLSGPGIPFKALFPRKPGRPHDLRRPEGPSDAKRPWSLPNAAVSGRQPWCAHSSSSPGSSIRWLAAHDAQYLAAKLFGFGRPKSFDGPELAQGSGPLFGNSGEHAVLQDHVLFPF